MAAWTTADVPSQAGRIAVITGGNTGLGFETARVLAGQGAQVVLASRDPAKAARAVSQLGGDASHVRLDLASLASVREAAAELHATLDRVDLLVNNAGVMMTPASTTEDGFELQYGTNYLGHFALTGLLLDLMLSVPGSRVVTLTSVVGLRGQYPPSSRYTPTGAYADSKLADLMFALELQRRLTAAGKETSSLAAHPGYASTGLTRHLPTAIRIAADLSAPLVAQRATMGALPILRAATDPDARGGELYGPRWTFRGYPVRVTVPAKARDTELAARLWSDSQESTGVQYSPAI
jgi:NAD(P)-dependent dehydrogenase (short-subunit alcohol dehydrogenase family)